MWKGYRMRRRKTWLKRLFMTLLLASGLPMGAETPLVHAQGGHEGISSRTGPSDVAGLPVPTPSAALPSDPGRAIASSLLTAWDKDRNLSLTDGEFGRAARSFFELADTRRDQRLTLDEVLGELAELLETPSAPASRQPLVPGVPGDRSGLRVCAYLAESLVVISDSDGDNEITAGEWRRASRKSFEQWDTNADGRLVSAELEKAVKSCLR